MSAAIKCFDVRIHTTAYDGAAPTLARAVYQVRRDPPSRRHGKPFVLSNSILGSLVVSPAATTAPSRGLPIGAYSSGRPKTAQGAAMPRKGCLPTETRVVVVSAATASVRSTLRPRGRHRPSSRLTKLTAGPIAVKSKRSAVPTFPQNISPRWRATPKCKDGRF
jgi:hypothetical protein